MSKMPPTGICFRAAYGHSSKNAFIPFRLITANHFGTKESWKLYQGWEHTHTPLGKGNIKTTAVDYSNRHNYFQAQLQNLLYHNCEISFVVFFFFYIYIVQPTDNYLSVKASNQIRNRCVVTYITRQHVKGFVYGEHISSTVLTTGYNIYRQGPKLVSFLVSREQSKDFLD